MVQFPQEFVQNLLKHRIAFLASYNIRIMRTTVMIEDDVYVMAKQMRRTPVGLLERLFLNSLEKASRRNPRLTSKMAYLYSELGILQKRFLEVGQQKSSMRRIDGQIPARYQCALSPRLAKP